jgi:hypothetical protein
VPYFDLTVSAVKSVSVLHASYRVSGRQARERGDQDQAAMFDARRRERGRAAGLRARSRRLAGAARHPHRAPFGLYRGVAGRRRPGRELVPALDSRSLHNQRLAVAPVADRILETKLSALGSTWPGNGRPASGSAAPTKKLPTTAPRDAGDAHTRPGPG